MKKKKSAAAATSGPAQALHDAHTAYLLEQLVGEGFEALVEQLLDLALAEAEALRLEQMVTRKTIKAVARTYAIELDLRGGIPELVGEVARALHAHPIHVHTKVSDLITPRRFEDAVDHVLGLKSLRRRLIEELISSPLYESIASELLYNGIRDYLVRSGEQVKIPGAASALRLGRAVVKRATASFEDALGEGIKRHIGRSVGSVSQKTAQALIDGAHDAELREAAMASWQHVRKLKLGALREDVTALDVEELFVTLYEWWKEFRGTPFLGAMIDTGVETFYEKYGEHTLAELLEDLGIDRAQMRAEAMRFAPRVLKEMHAAKRLEPLVRELLAPFYRSGAVERVLAATWRRL